MRVLSAVVLVLAALLGASQPAVASCAPPAPLAERAANAVAVVYGTVVGVDGASLTLRVAQSLKGQLSGTVRIFVGPGRGGFGGTAVATSVDYRATTGTDHVIYAIRGADGALETNACIGSHAGPPDADEVKFFGASSGGAPQASGAPAEPALAAEPAVRPEIVVALAAAALLAATTVFLRRRRFV